MFGQSFREMGRGGVGPLRFRGASSCWGRSVTSHSHWSVVDFMSLEKRKYLTN